MAVLILQHIHDDALTLFRKIWDNKKNPKYYGPILTIILAASYTSGLLQLLLYWILLALVVIFSVISGLAIVLCHGAHRQPPAPRPTPEQQNLTKFMEKMTKDFNKHYYTGRLVISRDLDKTIQEVIDLIIRDFCLSWFRDVGKDETAFVEILNKEFWSVLENLKERLKRVDTLNFLCHDLMLILYKHCQDLRLSDAGKYPGQTTPFLLHPCLKEKKSELNYLRTVAETLILCLLPQSDSQCMSMRFILREILSSSLLLSVAESVCDPDYINQCLVYYLEDKVKITTNQNQKQKQKYAYAETYEDFIKMINTTTDIEMLKQLRYHTIAEIMQATVIHNTKDHLSEKEGDSKSSKKQNKKDALRDRNLKKYINQCRVSKQQCEKRIRNLGGPDYRYYGLGHGQPLKGTDKSKIDKRKSKSVTILAFNDIMDNSLARSFFLMFLQKQGMGNLLSFWIAIEKLRLMKQSELQSSAASIFQEYVTPSAPTVIKLESRLVRGMEEFVYGIGERGSFYEAQKIVYDIMENKFYPEFLISPDYTKFVCESESALDEIRAHISSDQHLSITDIGMGDGFGFKERRNAEALKASMPSNIEERNDYAVRSLQALDHDINAKTQALDLIKRSDPVDEQEKERIELQLDRLSTERRHLEFHIERTDLWCEMLGHWKANISTCQYDDNKQPIFVICVSCDTGIEERNRDPGLATTGWVVCRQLKDFFNLHNKLKECCSWMSKDMPVSSKRWFKKDCSEKLESLKESLQEYLTIILGDERLAQSDEIYSFLIPSPEHLRGESSTSKTDSSLREKKSPLSFISGFKDQFQNLTDMMVDIADADEVEVGIEEESVVYRKDSIAESMYTLIGEVFELKGVFKVLRKTLITFVQVTFGGTINRHLREFVSWLVSEPMLLYYIDNFKQAWWPKGKLAPYGPVRSPLEKFRTKESAREKLMKSIPDVLSNLVGRRNSNVGFLKLFEAVQDVRTNKHLFYIFLELVITTICPEVQTTDLESIHDGNNTLQPESPTIA